MSLGSSSSSLSSFLEILVVFVVIPDVVWLLHLCIPVSKSVDTERTMWSAINPVGLERGSMLRLHAVGAKKFLPTGEILRLRPNFAGKSR